MKTFSSINRNFKKSYKQEGKKIDGKWHEVYILEELSIHI